MDDNLKNFSLLNSDTYIINALDWLSSLMNAFALK